MMAELTSSMVRTEALGFISARPETYQLQNEIVMMHYGQKTEKREEFMRKRSTKIFMDQEK